jgi:hypothetical protein
MEGGGRAELLSASVLHGVGFRFRAGHDRVVGRAELLFQSLGTISLGSDGFGIGGLRSNGGWILVGQRRHLGECWIWVLGDVQFVFGIAFGDTDDVKKSRNGDKIACELDLSLLSLAFGNRFGRVRNDQKTAGKRVCDLDLSALWLATACFSKSMYHYPQKAFQRSLIASKNEKKLEGVQMSWVMASAKAVRHVTRLKGGYSWGGA